MLQQPPITHPPSACPPFVEFAFSFTWCACATKRCCCQQNDRLGVGGCGQPSKAHQPSKELLAPMLPRLLSVLGNKIETKHGKE
mmetsp:Transcript_41850/g.62487  ORF Transcript_41850/g.62487 Transcript_41850/m.62487 type:complete len:84 (-) Transcript_41850:9-260(-)